MSVLTTLNYGLRRYREAVSRRRTERMIGALPAEIRKDIGWRGHDRDTVRIDGASNHLSSRRSGWTV